MVLRRDDPRHNGHPIVPSAGHSAGINRPRQQRSDQGRDRSPAGCDQEPHKGAFFERVKRMAPASTLTGFWQCQA